MDKQNNEMDGLINRVRCSFQQGTGRQEGRP
jgi:hypothetical protein